MRGIRECDGEPGPIDSTANRWEQDLAPDLELIRARGFAENRESLDEDRRIQQIQKDCPDLAPDIPKVAEWSELQGVWVRDAQVVTTDDSLTEVKAAMARCLNQRVGKEVDPAAPAFSFLRIANETMLDTDDWATGGEARYAAAYADCGKEYFAQLAEILLKQRPQQIERNREVLTEFATGIVKAGYVP